MIKSKPVIVAVTLVLMMTTVALAQTECEINKWIQLPDESPEGIDIRMDRPPFMVRRTLADDFLCEQTGPITCVKFWGSWNNDSSQDPIWKGQLTKIHLSIHSDVPAGADPDPTVTWSHPGVLLWEMDFDATSFTETLYLDLCPDPILPTCSGEGFWDPSYELFGGVNPGDTYVANADSRIWLYTVNIPTADAFVQQGTTADPIVYWLDIYVEILDDGITREFGWKTSIDNWNDNAVYDITGVDWAELMYPPGFINPAKIDGQIDLAFEINTKLDDPPTEACCYEEIDAAGNITIVCDDLTVADCLSKNGIPQGAGTDCTTVQCDPPLPHGACCLLDGTCIETTAADCQAHNGTYMGDGTSCSTPNICPTCVPPDVACTNGETPIGNSYLAGLIDNFAPFPDPATPDAALANYILNCTAAPGYALQFDELPGSGGVSANSWFGHTFTGLPVGIESATLEVRARATAPAGGGNLAWNDTIGFIDTISGCTRTDLWINRFSNLPEASGTWNAGQTATFCLDLNALPVVGGGTTSVISDLASGRLSVWAQDDTGIDYMLLRVRICPCKYPVVIPVTPATATPSAEMVSVFGAFNLKGFASGTPNRRFAHTFTGLPAGIVGGTLEIGLQAHADIPANDSIALEFLNPNFRWARSIAGLPGSVGGIGSWNNLDSTVLTLDLGNLPPSGTGETSVIADMTDGDLDVSTQDDTQVNYMILRLRVCCDDKIPGDIDGDGDVDLIDFAIYADNYLVGTGP